MTSILAMMFMVLFGSLAAAMAIVSQGNLQTAQAHLRVSDALSAADTGVDIAQARLAQAASTMRVWRGEITADFAEQLWDGTFPDNDDEPVIPEDQGLRDILADLHPQAGDPGTIEIDPAYTPQDDWLVTAPMILRQVGDQPASAFQVTYIPEELPDQDRLGIRAVVTGYAWDFVSQQWITRTAQQVMRLSKHPKQAILGPSKIMVGKNVQINGPVGARFTEVDNIGGHPAVVRSDFFGLDPILDEKLQDLYDAILAPEPDGDANGDNRLATQHTVESEALDDLAETYYDDGSGGEEADQIADFTDDGKVDEFDVFLKHFDEDDDGSLVLSEELTQGTPAEDQSPEFTADDDLGLLIDGALPDRNGDGVVDDRDTALGWRDGVIDHRDRYAKINGSVYFRTPREPWENASDGSGGTVGDYQQLVQGAIRPGDDEAITFDAGDETLPEINTDTFQSASSDLAQGADGGPFTSQVGVNPIFTLETNDDGVVVGQTLNPAFYNAGPDDDLGVVVEGTPFGAPAPADYYERPVFKNMTFKDVIIPQGVNALFVNCTFIGVTRVQNHIENTHPSWQFYGQQNEDLSLRYPPLPDPSPAQLDNEYFPDDGSIVPPAGFDVPRLTINGTKYVTTKPLSNNIRFEDCTFIGSIVADKPDNFTHIRNKLQFTGATQFHQEHPEEPDNPELNPEPADEDAIAKSSMMLPHYSVDVGENNAPTTQDVNLNGVVIAGVLDVRGTATIDGAMLLTFEPTTEDPALRHFGQPVGNPANFNTTLGYFGSDEGDEEGLAPFEYNGQTIVGFDTDGDGRVDTTSPEPDAVPVPFNGYGKIRVNWDPDLVMPDGLIAPLEIKPIASTYLEGRLITEQSQ